MQKILKDIKAPFITFLFLATILLLFETSISILESFVIDSIANNFEIIENNSFLSFLLLIIFIIIGQLLNLFFNYFYYKLNNKFSLYVGRSISQNFYNQYKKADIESVKKYSPEQAFNFIFNNSGNILQSSLLPLISIISVSINFIFIIIYFGFYNWIILLLVLSLLILNSFSKFLFFKKTEFYIQENQELFNRLTSEVSYYLERYSVLYFANKQNLLIKKLENSIYKYCQILYKKDRLSIWDSEISSAILELTKLVGLILLSLFYLKNQFGISLGIIYLFIKIITDLKSEFITLITDFQKFFASLILYKSLDLKLKEEKNHKQIEEIKTIKIKNLTLKQTSKTLFENLSIEIQKDKKYLIIGESGVGKSTFIKSILNMHNNYEGSIYINEYKSTEYNTREILKRITYLSPENFVFDLDIKNNVNLFDDKKIEEILDFFELKNEVIYESENQNFVSGNQLSLGQQQRLSLARTFFYDKDIYILDESLSNLNKELRNKILNKLISLNKTIIFISHHLDTAEITLFDEVINLNHYVKNN
ncbi:ABC transporter ATP-binding protein [Mycoplasmopsis felis]|uniref:ABC transporter ATP-binding protein n=1 Tax=Mycoplasmopsis felis TaxID=33923 RepID=UPI00300D1F2C